jgi:hypothetical protein
MKAIRLNTPTKNILLGIFTLMIVLSLESCAKNFSFLTSTVVPGAQGSVKLKRDNNKNYVIQIELSDLADVTRLQPAKQVYVVWMDTDQSETKNLGQLNSKTSFFSKRHKAFLKTVSSSNPIKIFITAEDQASIQYPGNMVVLSTDRFQQ